MPILPKLYFQKTEKGNERLFSLELLFILLTRKNPSRRPGVIKSSVSSSGVSFSRLSCFI